MKVYSVKIRDSHPARQCITDAGVAMDGHAVLMTTPVTLNEARLIKDTLKLIMLCHYVYHAV